MSAQNRFYDCFSLQFESKNCSFSIATKEIDRRMIHRSCILHPFIQTIRHSICVLPPVYTNVAYYLPRRKNTPLSSARQTRKSLYLRRIFLSFFFFFLTTWKMWLFAPFASSLSLSLSLSLLNFSNLFFLILTHFQH